MKLQEYEREHLQRLRKDLAGCTVLLKTDGAFPLSEPCPLALYGSGARHTVKGGTGSGEVNSRFFVTVEKGLKEAGFTLTSKAWLDAYDGVREQAKKDFVKQVRGDIIRRFGSTIAENMGKVRAEPEYDLPLNFTGETAVYVLGRNSGEGSDRSFTPGDILLTASEIRDILSLQQQAKRFLLVLNVGGPVDLSPVVNEVGNILLLSQLGVETGAVLADILLGKATPSGKLATTWAAAEDYPKIGDFGDRDDTRYREGIYVGYRYFDSAGVQPVFPFGWGLSWTSFELGENKTELDGETVTVSAAVKNTGAFPGRESLQLYVSKPEDRLDQAFRDLAAFAKTKELAPGGEEELKLTFRADSLASFFRGGWVMEQGEYILLTGSSAADCVPAARLTLKEAVRLKELTPICELLDSLPEIVPETDAARKALEAQAANTPEIAIDSAVKASTERKEEKRTDPLLERGRAIAEKLTAEQKIQLVIGANKARGKEVIGAASVSIPGAAGETTAFPEYGVPGMTLADGPAGLRLQKHYEINPEDGEIYKLSRIENLESRIFKTMKTHPGSDNRYQFTTAIPVGTLLAQSFDPAVLEKLGELIAEEMRIFGIAVWLAPGMNIHRNPLCGRNFEYYSEDPLVSGIMAAAICRGVEKQGDLAACIKHFACNNQEEDRFHVTANISQRALREIYLKGFEIAVKTAHPMSIMTSYNRINSVHTANSRDLCTVTAREEWGFTGFIMTDWTTTNMGHGSSAAKCILAGNDLIMPGSEADKEEIAAALRGDHDRPLPEEKLTESAARLIGAALQTGRSPEEQA